MFDTAVESDLKFGARNGVEEGKGGTFPERTMTLRSVAGRMLARLRLWKCERGVGVSLRGRPRVDGPGRIRLGDGVRIWSHLSPTHLSSGPGAELTIGGGTFVNTGVTISARGSVCIGERCQIAPGVVIMDNDFHGVDDRDGGAKCAPVTIGNDVWLATRSMVLRGVHIGDGAVVAAGAVVTRDVPPRTLVGGVPARVLRNLNQGE